MRNPSLRPTLIVLLVLASVFSYVYINTVQIGEVKMEGANTLTPQIEQVEPETQEQQRTMPDVEIVKLLLQKGKQILPAS
ncbi:MAG: hypothetical protein AAGG75_10205 [Bacteroidota bacterium]